MSDWYGSKNHSIGIVGGGRTGLGLFITKKVVEDHRGSIALHSKVSEGTRVLIRLPLLNHPDMALAG